MRKFFLFIYVTSISLLGFADPPSRGPFISPSPANYMTDCRFAGCYWGAHLGSIFHDTVWVDRDLWVNDFVVFYNVLGSATTRNNGLTGGLQLGYNWVARCALGGIEVDVSLSDLKRNKKYNPLPGNSSALFLAIEDHLKLFGTLRGRAGIIIDHLLLYATAGTVWADIKKSWTMFAPAGLSERFKKDKVWWGLALGGGLEWACCRNLSIKAEGLYFQFPEDTVSKFSTFQNGTVRFDLLNSVWIFRAGVNLKLYGLTMSR